MKIEYDALTNDYVINCTGGACGKLIKLARCSNMNEEEYLHFIEELEQALGYTKERMVLDFAHQYLTGFAQGKIFGDVVGAIKAMGLTKQEWESLKQDYEIDYLEDIENEVDNYYIVEK